MEVRKLFIINSDHILSDNVWLGHNKPRWALLGKHSFSVSFIHLTFISCHYVNVK